MNTRHPARAIAILALPLLLAAGSSALEPVELVRRANAAFDRQDYDLAVKLYTEAEATIDDPGLVAFNKGAALYSLGDYRKAQEHYQRCLEEADAPHCSALQYNLGNCLLQQAQASGDAALFRRAVEAYARCLRQPDGTGDVHEQARHNLELAKLLWLQVRLTRPSNNPDNDQGPDEKPEQPRPPDKGSSEEKVDEGTDANSGARPREAIKKRAGRPDRLKGDEKATETSETTPGQGHTPPPADDKQLKPLSAEDALRNLEAASKRIGEGRIRYRLRAAPAAPRGVPDW